jgi:hypothetical protein
MCACVTLYIVYHHDWNEASCLCLRTRLILMHEMLIITNLQRLPQENSEVDVF